jgi:hypothetical protein
MSDPIEDLNKVKKMLEGVPDDVKARILLQAYLGAHVEVGKKTGVSCGDSQRKASEDFMVATNLFKRGLLDKGGVALVFAQRFGDWNPLAEKVASDAPLFADERAFIADVLRGKKKPANRAPAYKTIARQAGMALAVLQLQMKGASTEQAVDKVAEEFGVDPRTVRRANSVMQGSAAEVVDIK